jgi:hypothetical protein
MRADDFKRGASCPAWREEAVPGHDERLLASHSATGEDMTATTPRWTPVRRIAIAAATFIAVALVLVAPLSQTARAAGMGFDAQPAPDTPNADLGYFKFDAGAGDSVARVLVLTNLTQDKKVISVAPCDATGATYGGIAYTDSGKKPTGVGTWISLSDTSVTLDPGATVEVPFEVRVPADASSGAHVAGVAVWEPASAQTSGGGDEGGDGASTKITTITRKVLTVYVTTPGASAPRLAISGVKAEARPDGMYLLIGIANNGTAIATGEGTVSVASGGFSQQFSLDQLVPTAKVQYPVKWTTDPAEGAYETRVEIKSEPGGKTVAWSGTFEIAGEQKDALADRLVTSTTPAGTSGGRPWLIYGLLGGLIVIVVVMGLALMRKRRPAPGP